MKIRHLILMLLKASGDRIESKTKLQKEIYFISLLLGRNLEFKAHYYGPYSFNVEQGLDELIGAGFINMKRDVFGIDMERGFEVKRYEFYLTASGKKFVKILEKENSNEYKKIKEFVNKLKEIRNPDYISLSIAAKTYFILNKEGEHLSKSQIIDKANKLGWDISKNDINVAIDILKKLDLM